MFFEIFLAANVIASSLSTYYPLFDRNQDIPVKEAIAVCSVAFLSTKYMTYSTPNDTWRSNEYIIGKGRTYWTINFALGTWLAYKLAPYIPHVPSTPYIPHTLLNTLFIFSYHFFTTLEIGSRYGKFVIAHREGIGRERERIASLLSLLLSKADQRAYATMSEQDGGPTAA